MVDDCLRTSDDRVFAIGEVALHRGVIHGLVAPGYEMANVLARHLAGKEAAFDGADSSAKLKLLGTDVATFGEPFQDLHGAGSFAMKIRSGAATRSSSFGRTDDSSSVAFSSVRRRATARFCT